MLARGQVPADIEQNHNEAATKSKSPRWLRTELINRSAEFQSWRSNLDMKFATAESVGVPYSIALWQVMQGQEQAMKVAEQRGDIFQDNGMWHHRKVSSGRTKKHHRGHAAFMNQWLGKRGWNKFGQQEVKDTQAVEQACHPGHSSWLWRMWLGMVRHNAQGYNRSSTL